MVRLGWVRLGYAHVYRCGGGRRCRQMATPAVGKCLDTVPGDSVSIRSTSQSTPKDSSHRRRPLLRSRRRNSFFLESRDPVRRFNVLRSVSTIGRTCRGVTDLKLDPLDWSELVRTCLEKNWDRLFSPTSSLKTLDVGGKRIGGVAGNTTRMGEFFFKT